MIQTHSDEVNQARRRTFHELNSLNLARLVKNSTFGLGLTVLREDPNETLFKILLAFFFIIPTSFLKKNNNGKKSIKLYLGHISFLCKSQRIIAMKCSHIVFIK